MSHKIKLLSNIFFCLFFIAGCGFVNGEDKSNVEEEKLANPTSLNFDSDSLTLSVGDKAKITPIFAPANCNKQLEWTSDAPSIVRVDSSGNLEAKKLGRSTISAKTVNSIVATCVVTVTNYDVESIKLETSEIELIEDSTYTISNYSIEPNNAKANIKFEVPSSDSAVLSVDSNGVVSALSSGKGVVYIYHDSNESGSFNQNSEVYASLRVTVVEKINIEMKSTVSAPFYYNPDIDLNSATNITINTFNSGRTIPYISGKQVQTMFSQYLANFLYKKYDNYYAFEIWGGAIKLYPDTNLMVLYNWQYYISPLYSSNGNFPLDICSPSNNSNMIASPKTKEITSHNSNINIQLSDYSLKIIEFNDEIYLPFDVVSSFVFNDFANFVYDGTRIYDSNKCSRANAAYRIPFFYSSENAFSFYDDIFGNITFYKQSSLGTNQKYLYRSSQADDYSHYINAEMVFNNDGTGSYICGINNDGSYTTFNDPSYTNSFSFTYEEEADKKLIKVKKNGSSSFNYYIGTSPSRFGKNELADEYKNYWYNSLCLKLDYFYGLKWKLTSGSFIDFFKTAKLKLYKNCFSYFDPNINPDVEKTDTIYNLCQDAKTVDQASKIVANMFAYYFGDCHSQFIAPSPFGTSSTFAVSNSSEINNSQRVTEFFNTLDSLKNKRSSNQGSPDDDIYYDSAKRLAVLQFSSFQTSVIPSRTNYASFENDDGLVYIDGNFTPPLGSNIVYYSVNQEGFKNIAKQLSKISKTTSIKNIIFDITTNGGGKIMLVPLLLAFMTNDPSMVVKSTITGGITEYHYLVDLNGNGVYGEESDSLSSRFKFFILQSSYSFSSASAFSAVAKNTGAATIIGDQRSGGGSCMVTYGNDALGNLFRLSGTLETMMADGNGGYVSDDDGIIADQTIDREYFYQPNTLATTITGLK